MKTGIEKNIQSDPDCFINLEKGKLENKNQKHQCVLMTF